MANEKRLIDANAFIEEHCADCKYFNVEGICTKEDPVCGSVMIVSELPTVDAVEVCRCKDCKHYTERKNVAYNGHFCERMVEFVQPEDFCSYGERRTE